MKINKGTIKERIIINNFSSSFKFTFNFGKYDGWTIDKVINENLQYIDWVLKNLDEFAILPSELEREFDYNKVVDVIADSIIGNQLQFKPVYKTMKYKFPKELINLNRKKINKINNVKYDNKYNCYTPNLTDEELLDYYEYYLNENYIPLINENEFNLGDFYKVEKWRVYGNDVNKSDNNNRLNKTNYSSYDSYSDTDYCGACMESPCMCSDPF